VTPPGLRERLAWRVNRLRCMSIAEIAHRVREAAYAHLQRQGLLTAKQVPEAADGVTGPRWLAAAPALAPASYVTAADEVAAGRMDVLSLHDAAIGCPPRWNRDPQSGQEFPVSFGQHLDYRRLAGADIKYVWEPNRHLQLVTLAQAYALTADARHLAALRTQIESWLEQCPYLRGANWSSSLEAGIRLINWSLAWQLAGGAASPLFAGAAGAALRHRWLDSIYQHMHFIRHRLSRHSSANNHLIGEAAGLLVASITWPLWTEARQWGATAQRALEREALLQNAPDGGNREQAFAYQQFVLGFLLVAGLARRAAGTDFPAAYWNRVEAMIEFVASMMDVGGGLPMIGDADDGFVMRLSQEPGWCPFHSLLATGAVLFRRGDFRAKAGRVDEQTRWLLGDDAGRTFDELLSDATELPVRKDFPESGYYILGDRFETPDEIRLVVDAGPLGYLGIAAHGHADALAMTLSVGGSEFLVDPGTYAYNTERKWRDYFRGTGAHNTVRIDGLDQSEIGGAFMWLRKARAHCERWTSNAVFDELIANHDGYTRLSDPVMHRRTVRLDKRLRRIEVSDDIECRREHSMEIRWHFAESCRVRETEGRVVAERDGQRIVLAVPEGHARLELLCGDSVRPAGWVSRSFGKMTPATTAIWHVHLARTLRIVTFITIE
jgi:hypothetical protein